MPASKAKKTDRIEGAEFLKFRCNGCGNCCRLRIPVTDDDVRRLMEATRRPAHKVVQFFSKSEFGRTPGQLAYVKLGPRLRDRKAMCVRETGDRCFFLRKNRCIVYEQRPIVCREHPFDLTLDKNDRKIEVVEMNLICECAHTLDGKMSKRELKKVHHLSLAQDDSYFAKVRRWNRRRTHGNERDFLEYLGLV